ncbi:MAG: hypothetical protein ACLPKT_07495 [Methylocella sp.]
MALVAIDAVKDAVVTGQSCARRGPLDAVRLVYGSGIAGAFPSFERRQQLTVQVEWGRILYVTGGLRHCVGPAAIGPA